MHRLNFLFCWTRIFGTDPLRATTMVGNRIATKNWRPPPERRRQCRSDRAPPARRQDSAVPSFRVKSMECLSVNGMNNKRRLLLAFAVAGLIPSVASAQLGTGAAGRAAGTASGAAQASRAQAQAQQRVQAQVQQRAQAQIQQRAQAQLQQRAQTRVTGAANAARGAAAAAGRRVGTDAALRADASLRADGRAGAGRSSANVGANARVGAGVDMRLSEADMHYYDDVFGRFNPFRQPPQRSEGNAFASGNGRNRSANGAEARPAGQASSVAVDSAADLNARIGHAIRMRQTEISQIRDRALESGDARLMLQAEELEGKLKGFANAQARANAAANSALNRGTSGATNSAFNASATAVANAAANSAVARAAADRAAADGGVDAGAGLVGSGQLGGDLSAPAERSPQPAAATPAE